jgi:pimeloyl-ACP methyl ester carboxylesterase
MRLVLTLLVLVLATAIVSLVTWEIVHRRSRIVRLWNPSSFPGRFGGGLGVLEGGVVSDLLGDRDPEAIVLLHGLGSTADYFGDVYEGLANTHRLVMPDLLGFGRSLDEQRVDFGIDAHVHALEGALAALGLGERRLHFAAHSMGASLALAFAKRHPDRVVGVVLWSPPVYPPTSSSEAIERLGDEVGGLSRVLLADNEWAQRLCRWNCDHRRASGWVMAALAPTWPIDVSRRAALHTWDAFMGSLGSLVVDADWAELFDLDAPVTVVRGADDTIGDRAYLASVAQRASIVDVEGADHHVALTHPHLLFDLLDRPHDGRG